MRIKIKKSKIKLYKKLFWEILEIIFKHHIFLKMWFLFLLIFVVSFVFDNLVKTKPDLDYQEYAYQDNLENIKIENDFSSDLSQKEKYDQIILDYKKSLKQKEIELSSATQVRYDYFPSSFEWEMLSNTWVTYISETIFSDIFSDKKLSFDLEFYKTKIDVRWKFVDNTIKLFWVWGISEEELLSVFIHELWHYFDINYLEKKVLFDLSDNFYDISWKTPTILKDWSYKTDFVSWYAMTNKYEDFAETFTYYVLFNDDFRQKMSYNPVLQKKYDFFSRYIFRNDEFKKTNFRNYEKKEDYYWDITKINFSVQNFLEYLKKWI